MCFPCSTSRSPTGQSWAGAGIRRPALPRTDTGRPVVEGTALARRRWAGSVPGVQIHSCVAGFFFLPPIFVFSKKKKFSPRKWRRENIFFRGDSAVRRRGGPQPRHRGSSTGREEDQGAGRSEASSSVEERGVVGPLVPIKGLSGSGEIVRSESDPPYVRSPVGCRYEEIGLDTIHRPRLVHLEQ